MSLKVRIALAALVACLIGVAAFGVVYIDRRVGYLFGAPEFGYSEIEGRFFDLGLPHPHSSDGSLIAADLDGSRPLEIIVTGPGYVSVFAFDAPDSGRLWLTDVPIQLSKNSSFGILPGSHSPGVQLADVNGDGAVEVLLLTTEGTLVALDARTGALREELRLPAPPADAQRWEHLVVASFRHRDAPDLLLQATDATYDTMNRFLAAFALDTLVREEASAAPLWTRSDFLANAHHGARVADLDGDGRHEVLGGDVIGPDGVRRLRLSVVGHLDALYFANVRPDLPGLEAVALEERGSHMPVGPGPEPVFLYNGDRVVWARQREGEEPQNAAIGDFDPERPGLEIWLRSRRDRHQEPWVLDATGKMIAAWGMRDVAPIGWTVAGVETIVAIDWNGGPALAVAKERHREGDVAIFEPMTGRFIERFKAQANRLYVADVIGDGREEILIREGSGIRLITNPDPDQGRPSPWREDHYRLSKQTWNYYSP